MLLSGGQRGVANELETAVLLAALNDAASAGPTGHRPACSHSAVANSDVGQILEDVSEEKRHKLIV